MRERVEEIVIPKYVEPARPLRPKPPLLANLTDEALLGFGVPPEWLVEVRAANEDSLLDLADHLQPEAAEAPLNLATGVTPQVAPRPVLRPDSLKPGLRRRHAVRGTG